MFYYCRTRRSVASRSQMLNVVSKFLNVLFANLDPDLNNFKHILVTRCSKFLLLEIYNVHEVPFIINKPKYPWRDAFSQADKISKSDENYKTNSNSVNY